MRAKMHRALLCVSLLVVAACSARPIDADLAFTHVTVVPMDSQRTLADQTVLVRGDRIVAVGPAASTRVGARARVVVGAVSPYYRLASVAAALPVGGELYLTARDVEIEPTLHFVAARVHVTRLADKDGGRRYAVVDRRPNTAAIVTVYLALDGSLRGLRQQTSLAELVLEPAPGQSADGSP